MKITNTKSNNSFDIFQKIMTDPEVMLSDPDESGNMSAIYNNKDIGWINPQTGSCSISEEYDKDVVMSADDVDVDEEFEEISEDIDSSTALEDILLDPDIMKDTVDAIYANTGDFDKSIFTPAEEFFQDNSNKSMKEMLQNFYNGTDLDDGGSADPNKKYFRLTKSKEVESTDYPGDIYIDEILDEVVDYIKSNSEDTYYPEEILNILTEDSAE